MSNKEEILDQEELEVADNSDTMEEETAAAASIAPKGKVSTMSATMELIHQLKGEDLNKFNAMMAQFAAGKEYGVGDGSAEKRASVAMKPSAASASMKEDLEVIFNGENLSEEFIEKTSTLFEAAVNARLNVEVARIEEEYEEKLNEEMSSFAEDLTTKLDSYLDYITENWMKENEVAIESTLRNELMEEFMEGLKNLFAEHYISVPEEKVDVLEALAEKVDAMETKLDEAITENNQLRAVLVEEAAKKIFVELASDLALTQQEKFAALAEGIEFDGDLETFAKKLNIIKESYFNNDSSTTAPSSIEEETFEGETKFETGNSVMSRYAQAIARTVKK